MSDLNSWQCAAYVAELTDIQVHSALVSQNRCDFGHSGYDGMQHLCESDQDMYLWGHNSAIIWKTEFNDGFAQVDYVIHPTIA